jgi:AcrR family transcriptional regulator
MTVAVLHSVCSLEATRAVQFCQNGGMPEQIEEPQNARSRRTRAALLASARSLLEEHGTGRLTMTAVAELAGVSRRAAYLHFPSRADLLIELFGYVSEEEDLASSLEMVWQARDAAAALDEWASHLARFHPRVLAVALAVQRVRRTDPDAASQWVLVMADQQACCFRLASWLAAEQRLATPWTVQTAADMLWALMSYELLEELLVDRGWSVSNYRTHLTALFRATFLRDSGKAQAPSAAGELGRHGTRAPPGQRLRRAAAADMAACTPGGMRNVPPRERLFEGSQLLEAAADGARYVPRPGGIARCTTNQNQAFKANLRITPLDRWPAGTHRRPPW